MELDYAAHINYVHFNPLKKRYVSRIQEWPSWTFHCYVHDGILRVDGYGDVSDLPTVSD